MKETLQSNAQKLLEADKKSAALESSLFNQRSTFENEKLNLISKLSQISNEHPSKGPKV